MVEAHTSSVPDAEPAANAGLRLQSVLARARTQGLAIVLIALIAIFCATAPGFGTLYNFSETLRDLSILGILGIGETFVLIAGGIDLSVGIGASARRYCCRRSHSPQRHQRYACRARGPCCGRGRWIRSTGLSLPVCGFRLSLSRSRRSTSSAASGCRYTGRTCTTSGGLINDENFLILGQSDVIGVPVSFIIFAVLLGLGAFILRRTRFGASSLCRRRERTGGAADRIRVGGCS